LTLKQIKLKLISDATDLFMVMIYPYNKDLYFVVYQAYDGTCVRVDMQNINYEEQRETIFP